MSTVDFDGSSRSSAHVTTSAHVSAPSYWVPEHLIASAWLEHAPFASWLVDAARPSTLVELGTHRGFSFFAFCDAVARLRLPAKTFAVDTWRGDDHAGTYEEEIYQYVSSVAARDYGFASLLRGYFDEMVSAFDPGTIDLLHIDGRHGYEDARHDFLTWLPMMSDRGVVLFHDIAERREGFGVWRLWEELRDEHPSFAFEHAHGLGVLGIGTRIPAALDAIFNADSTETARIRQDYVALGERVAHFARLVATGNEANGLRSDVEELRSLVDASSELNAALTSAVEEFSSSTSWRVTRPLRGLGALLRRG